MTQLQNYDLVTPGELLAESGTGLPGTYGEGERVFSKYFGMVQISDRGIGVTPLTGVYTPHEGDDVIGRVMEVSSKYWVVDINAPYHTRLNVKDLNFRVEFDELDKIMDMGDLLYARVFRIYGDRAADLSMRGTRYGKLSSNMIVNIDPVKLPRLIGKEGAMVNLIKEETKCDILIGRNGIVWVDGGAGDKAAALSAIKLIDEEFHSPNLMEKVKELFEHVRGTTGQEKV